MHGINYKVSDLFKNEANKHYLNKCKRTEAQKLANVNKQLNIVGSLNNLLFLIPLIKAKQSQIKLFGNITYTNFVCLIIMKYIADVTGSNHIHYSTIRNMMFLMIKRTKYRNVITRLKEQGYISRKYINIDGKQSFGHYYITEAGHKLLKQHSRNLILESEKIIDKLTELAQNH